MVLNIAYKLIFPFPNAFDELFSSEVEFCEIGLALKLFLDHRLKQDEMTRLVDFRKMRT